MNIADDFAKLQKLREQGVLSEQEFVEAKRLVLKRTEQPTRHDRDRYVQRRPPSDFLSEVVKQYVLFRVIFGFVGVVVMLILFFKFFLPLVPVFH